MKKELVIFFLIGLAIAFLFSQYTYKQQKKIAENIPTISPLQKETQYFAYFAIFTNGTFRLFNDEKYHNKSQDIFIEKNNVNKIIIKKSGTTWEDFFETLPMSLNKDCLTTGTGQVFCTNEVNTLKFYINGKRDNNALQKPIQENDALLVTYGPDNGDVSNQLERLSDIK